MPNILIADDEPHVVRVMRLALERAGYSVEFAPNGEEAYRRLTQQRPDALITDIDMPKMTGKELCQKIEAEMPGRTFPIFVLTSKTDIEHREWSRDIDNLAFIEKPASLRQLTSLLDRWLKPSLSAAQD